MDALSYTELEDSNISGKLPEIAMMQYKIAEAKTAKAEKQHADMFSAMKYSIEGFNPDLVGIQKGYESIVSQASEIAMKQGYQAAQQFISTQKGIVDMLSKMSTAQKEKHTTVQNKLNDSKFKEEDPEGWNETYENAKKYSLSDPIPKEKYAEIRSKYGISDAIPDETLRPLVRQNEFGEGESLVVYNPLGDYTVNAQKTVSGVKVDAKLNLEGQSLVLNGAGTRVKLFMDMYVGALYLEKKTANANEIMNSKEGAAIKLNIVSGLITSDKMVSAINEGFENSTGKKTTPLKAKIDKFKGFFKEEIKKGDVFVILNVPNNLNRNTST
jgi:hypothetical protein